MIGLAIKLTGALLIAAGGIMTGFKIRRNYGRRRSILKSMQDALKYADDAISIENTLLDDVLVSCGVKFFAGDKGEDVFTLSAGYLRNEFGSFERAWDKACAEFYEKYACLKKEDTECISGIGKAFGIADTQRQSAHIASAVKRLAALEQDANAAETREGKNAVKIALAVSAAVIIVLF